MLTQRVRVGVYFSPTAGRAGAGQGVQAGSQTDAAGQPLVEAFAQRFQTTRRDKVTYATFTFVAIDDSGRPRPIPPLAQPDS